jgi:hypothetical protein
MVLLKESSAEDRAAYLVRQAGGQWTIQFCGRCSDRFDDRDDAILTAIIRAENAKRHGQRTPVLLEEHGHERAVWDEEPDSYFRSRRSH